MLPLGSRPLFLARKFALVLMRGLLLRVLQRIAYALA